MLSDSHMMGRMGEEDREGRVDRGWGDSEGRTEMEEKV